MRNKFDLEVLAQELSPQFASGVADRDASARFVAEHYETLKKNKVFSALVPTELGGGGQQHSKMCAFIRTLAHHCSSTALALSMHQHLVSAAVYNFRAGRPGQKLLERVAANEAVLISTGANDWLSSTGSAERVHGGYRVTAKKAFASGCPSGDLLITSAPYQDPDEGWQVLHFPLPIKSDGVSLAGDWQTMGMRATGSETVVLDRVFVPDEAVVLKRPRGPYHAAFNVIITVAMPLIVSAYLGTAEAAVAIAKKQATKRKGDAGTPFLLGELTNHITTAQLAADEMVRLANDWDFEATPELASAVLVRKTIASNAILATVEKALETAGGAGFYSSLGLERLIRDAHGVQFRPLPEKRQHEFTGRLIMGLDPVASAPAA